MTGVLFMRRGASLVHRGREDDTPDGFAHSICGLSFARRDSSGGGRPQVIEVSDDHAVTCPECQAIEARAERAKMLAAVPMREVYTPKPSAEDAAAWAGPQVEILRSVTGEDTETVAVFLDGIEVPAAHVTDEVVDPTRGYLRSQWEADTRDVLGDVTMTSPFRSLLVQERNYALHADQGRYIVPDDETILKEC